MPEPVDHWTWKEMSFRAWRNIVNKRLKDIYLIDLSLAGIDDGYLVPHWQDKQAPFEFVEWYALKRDLEPKSAVWL